MRIAVGISGGVDSSVVAYLLKKQGHDVIGVNMKLLKDMDNSDAAAVCEHLGIPFYPMDMTEFYRDHILKYIQEDYSSGRTPNPCVRCNKELKFGRLLDRAMEIAGEFDRFATGHYARIIESDTGRLTLYQGLHGDKDQAYFLSLLSQEQLSRVLFPLGEMTKDEVRAIAKEAGLFTHEKGESQDLCVGEYRNYIDLDSGPGDFVDLDGKVLGTHKGIENYTVGQRRGLDIAAGYPIYVVSINKEKNQVVVGPNEALFSDEMIIEEVNWGAIEKPPIPWTGRIKIRYRDQGVEAQLAEDLGDGRFKVCFSEPRRAVTPGQLAVFYMPDGGVALAGVIC